MIKACLFDLDGTLLNTITTIAHYANYALCEHGIDPIEVDEYRYFVGNGAKKLVERMLRHRDVYSEETYHKIYKCYMESYDANPTHLTEPYPGILEMLSALKKRDIAVGVISNKPDFATRAVCKAKFPDGALDFVRGQVEGVPIKPDIAGPMEVLSHLGADAANTVYIGDTAVDMLTGANLGSYKVGVSWGFRPRKELIESGADKIVDLPLEIIDIIDSLNSK